MSGVTAAGITDRVHLGGGRLDDAAEPPGVEGFHGLEKALALQSR